MRNSKKEEKGRERSIKESEKVVREKMIWILFSIFC